MPNRIIKESIRTSDSINDLSWFEEVLFYRLIVSCDDYGRFDGRTAIIKGACFPLKDGVTVKNIESALSKLVSAGLVKRYVVDGKPYLSLPAWEQHQSIRAKKSKYPSPDDSKENESENICMQMQSDVPVFENPNPNPNTNTNTYSSEEEKYHYKEIISYLNEKAGTEFKPSTKSTRDNIRGRINEGYTLDDFKHVIEVKVSQWGKEPEKGEKDMRKYLRPITLFGSKFEGYLQEKNEQTKKKAKDNNNFERRKYSEEMLAALQDN